MIVDVRTRAGRRSRRLRGFPLLVGLLVLTISTTAITSDALEQPVAGEGLVVQQAEPLSMPSEPAPTPRTPEPPPHLQAGIDAASQQARAVGATVGIAVLDRATGQQWTNGPPAHEALFAASLTKLFIADNLLFRQQAGQLVLPAGDRALLEATLTDSDDSAADQLYQRYGGEQMIAEVAARYALPSLRPTNQAGFWELTTISAVDLIRWYDAFLATAAPTVVEFMVGLLRASPELAADGFNQYFGIPRALPGQVWAIKQGWMSGVRDSTFMHTTGLLGPDNRYAVAILVQNPGGQFPIDLIDRLAAAVLPPGLPLSAEPPSG